MSLRTLPECDQDVVISCLLRRLWRSLSTAHPFRSLSYLTQYWTSETLAYAEHWPDANLVAEGLRLFKELTRSATTEVLLATDLLAGNVLRAEREPWLVIDPKPSWEIQSTTRPSICSIVGQDCNRTRRERFEAFPASLASNTNVSACGLSPARRRSRARIGATPTWHSREQSARRVDTPQSRADSHFDCNLLSSALIFDSGYDSYGRVAECTT
jgi:hypothetical protein